MADKPLTAKSSIGDWLKHPVGGDLLRALLAEGGQNESALKPVRMLSLQRLVAMSGGMLPQDRVDAMVAQANGGVAPADDEDADDGTWVEQTTPGRFDGRTVIVTGAGSGIGRAVASRVAREGARVIAVDISEERLAEFAGAHGDAQVTTVVGDITKEDDVAKVVAAAEDRIDGLANVAGINDDQTPLAEVSDAMWDRVIGVNVTGMMRLTRAVLQTMLAVGRGAVVNIASEAGLRGSAAGVAYTTSKHAVVGLTRSTAFMYGPSGIRVNAVAPGGVATNIESRSGSELGAERIGVGLQVIPGIAMPEQLAASITFLLSDDATNLNGVILPSDGGWSVA